MWCSSLACKDVGEKLLLVESLDGALKWVFSLVLCSILLVCPFASIPSGGKRFKATLLLIECPR